MVKEKVVLFGNGINRVDNDGIDWQKLINRVAKKLDKKMQGIQCPNTLLHEFFIHSLDGGSNKENNTAYNQEVITKLNALKTNDLYSYLRDLNIENYLTTNYDDLLEKSFKEKYKNVSISKNINRSETVYSIRTCSVLELEEMKKCIWHIHGDVTRPKSIQLSFEHYCNSVTKINNCLNGNYIYAINTKDNEKDKGKKIPALRERLQDGYTGEKVWVDFFFKSDMHILALGLDYTEIDIWMILAKRKRMQSENNIIINNCITYYDVAEKEDGNKKALLGSLNVQYKWFKPINNDYKEQYKEILEIIKTKQ